MPVDAVVAAFGGIRSSEGPPSVLHLAVDSLQPGAEGCRVVEQTVRVVDRVGVADLLAAAFDLRDEPAEEIAAYVIEAASPGTPGPPDDEGSSIQYRTDGRSDAQRIRPSALADRLLSTLNSRRLLDVDPGPHLHASAVADDEGQVVLAMTGSHGGKSTFAAHLVHRGWHLVNDEQVRLLAGDGMVGAFRRPIAIKAKGVGYLPIEVTAPEAEHDAVLVPTRELGGTWVAGGRPAIVCVLARADEHDGPVVARRLHPVEVLAACCANNLDLARDPEPALAAFAWLASTTPGYELRYGTSAEAAGEAERLAVEAERLDLPHAVLADDEPFDAHHVGRWARSPEAITVGVDGRAVLYHRETRTVARLNEQAAHAWIHLGESAAVAEANEALWQQLAGEGLVVERERERERQEGPR